MLIYRIFTFSSEQSHDETDQSAVFFTSLNHIHQIYKYLHRNLEEEEFRQLILDLPLVYIPSGPHPDRNNMAAIIKGTFHKVSHVCWEDRTGLLEKYQPSFHVMATGDSYKRLILAPHYEGHRVMEHFFRNNFGVVATPTISEYVTLLVKVSDSLSLPNNLGIHEIKRLYQALGEKCVDDDHYGNGGRGSYIRRDPTQISLNEYANTVRQMLENQKILPTLDNRSVLDTFQLSLNSSNVETTFVQSTRRQRFLKTIETLSCWY